MKQAELYAPESMRLIETDIPCPGAGEILIEVRRVGICGSDLHAYHGKHPFIQLPVVPGHEFSGLVAEVGENVRDFAPGQRVTVEPSLVCGECYNCRHNRYNICENLKVIGCQTTGALGEYLVVPADKVLAIPESVSFDQAALVEPAAVAVHAVRKGNMTPGANAYVMGGGTIGLMTLQVAKALGAGKVAISDLLPDRLSLARELGADETINPRIEDPQSKIQSIFPDGVDIIFECVGVPATVHEAIRVARKGARLILAGVFEEDIPVPLGQVQDRELELIGTLMYQYDDFPTAIELIHSGQVKADPLISHHFPLEEAARAFSVADSRSGALKVLIDVS